MKNKEKEVQEIKEIVPEILEVEVPEILQVNEVTEILQVNEVPEILKVTESFDSIKFATEQIKEAVSAVTDISNFIVTEDGTYQENDIVTYRDSNSNLMFGRYASVIVSGYKAIQLYK